MLDSFEILSTSGVVLWSKTYVPIGPSVVNSLIKDVFIEGRNAAAPDESRGPKPTYKKDKYTLKWTTAKDLGLIFVAVYQSLLHLSWVDELLDNIRALFTGLYGEQLKKSKSSAISVKFDSYFDRQVQELEKTGETTSARHEDSASDVQFTPPSTSSDADPSADELPPPIPGLRKADLARPISRDDNSTDVTPIPTPETSRPTTPAVNNHLLTAKGGPGGRGSRRSRKAASSSSAQASSGDESPARRGKGTAGKAAAKKMRKWDAEGMADEDDGTTLDYSGAASGGEMPAANVEEIRQDTWGRKTKKGEFVLKDLDEEMDSIIAASKEKQAAASEEGSSGLMGQGIGAISGLFRNVVGGKKLTKDDLVKPLKAMEDHLLNKNVAREAAVQLCQSVETELIGSKTATFTSMDTTIRAAMNTALIKILTPTTSLDLLRVVEATRKSRPFVISIVGVNGVGKSTNLSKLAFFFLQNQYRVLIAAGDTFRSGAVEQLRVHVRNLKELTKREGGEVDIFERGYGKDAANIAKDAVQFAAEQHYDVVLIDTAGRRHNDTRLMSSLEKFAKLAQPDKIFMVGEALVGTDSVAQARNFNDSFGPGRGLDGFVVSKCDTVGDMVGTLVSMVFATGIPIVFLGVGQHYSDLRGFSVAWAVQLLMS
ncbi:putative signal sequence receptor alpha subunit [Aulographum hederae CBS 113979]|uniref:Signal recognition particle receptor subunit alpha homolog n=1 Tax=Aulographum hederae CBS 113979 TaxID=1176131 RepID=A0A6G1HET4_9PEZI|nr:putative signal sequence receptor alpha subunit [Aulographum hederae CBS 113979]